MESQNCLASENGATCSTCKDQYRNNDGVCEQIDIPNCIAYTGDKCSNCGDKHLYDGECYDVIENCTNQTGNTCTECNNNMLAQNNQCYTRIPNCAEQAGNTCNSCGSMLLQNNTCYARINNCSVQNANTCTTCAPGYKISGSTCVEKYPGGIYVAGLNKVVWIVPQVMTWYDASHYCQDNRPGMYLPSIAEYRNMHHNYNSQLNFPMGQYWSRDEIDAEQAYRYNTWTGDIQPDYYKGGTIYIACLGEP